jgi:hypothetical protein
MCYEFLDWFDYAHVKIGGLAYTLHAISDREFDKLLDELRTSHRDPVQAIPMYVNQQADGFELRFYPVPAEDYDFYYC